MGDVVSNDGRNIENIKARVSRLPLSQPVMKQGFLWTVRYMASSLICSQLLKNKLVEILSGEEPGKVSSLISDSDFQPQKEPVTA